MVPRDLHTQARAAETRRRREHRGGLDERTPRSGRACPPQPTPATLRRPRRPASRDSALGQLCSRRPTSPTAKVQTDPAGRVNRRVLTVRTLLRPSASGRATGTVLTEQTRRSELPALGRNNGLLLNGLSDPSHQHWLKASDCVPTIRTATPRPAPRAFDPGRSPDHQRRPPRRP